MTQISLFDGEQPFKITKPIRLIELFAGIGAQAKALENLCVDFEHYRICEFDKYAVASYNAVHNTNFVTSDITKIHADDLAIVDTDKYEYIMTYSFPCQDLSIAGKQSGMAKGSGTRSGLLWEVERLLRECKELPQVLLMENVPQVLNCDFGGWVDFLDSLGYKNYYKKLNAKNFGIPQNRERCFMVSVLGNYYYDFPKEIPLKLRLKDMLESKVDEKYYLRAEQLGNIKLEPKENQIAYPIASREFAAQGWKDISPTICARDYKDPKIIAEKCQVVGNLNIHGRMESACRVHGIDGIAPACNTCGGGGHETKIAEPVLVGGIGEINFGKQFRQGNRIYDSEAIACALNASPVGNAGGESYLYKVAEPTILTPKRTEYGKAIRKDYEAGLHKESRHNFTQLEPKQEPTSNTITTVQKDNMLIEPRIFDMYNHNEIKTGICGTITANGNTSSTHCGTFGIVEPIIVDDIYNNREPRKYGETAPTLRSERQGLKVVEQSYVGVGVHPISKKLEFDGYHDTNCPTLLATDYKAPKTILYSNYRIRKLTPKECWRLMGFDDSDFEKAKSAGVSNSQLYKQAGNSIVVDVLMAIFKEIL